MRTALAALLLALLALAAAARAAAPTAAAASAATASFAASARGVRRGGKLRVTNYKLEGDVTASTLELTRFEVFAPDATVRALLAAAWAGRAAQGQGRRAPHTGGAALALQWMSLCALLLAPQQGFASLALL